MPKFEVDFNAYNWEKMSPEYQALSDMVDAFAKEMKRKLLIKMQEGYSGWDMDSFKLAVQPLMIEHAQKAHENGYGPIDVANFAAFMWNLE